jgi:hypothetical protein
VISDVVDIFDGVEGSIPVQAFAPTKVKSHYSGVIDPTLFGTIIKDELINLMDGISMEVVTLILVQLETTIVPATITPNLVTPTEDPRVDVKVEVKRL